MISEEEMDEGITPEVVTPEVVPSGQLITLVNQSGLPESKSAILVERFSDLFKLASEWAKKAKEIIVTSGDQVVTIKHARAGRLLLREKRLEVENIRKILKQDALKEGQAIDRIANFLKDLIIPTEEHLDRQEHFVEYQKKAEDEARRVEIEKKMEAERLAKEQEDAKERDRLRKENERLRLEQIARDKIEESRRREMQEKFDKERAQEKERQEKIFNENNAKLAQERAKRDLAEAELLAKRQAEAKAEADRLREQERLASAGDTDKMIAFRAAVQSIKIPEVKSAENKRIIEDAKSHLFLAIRNIKIEEEE